MKINPDRRRQVAEMGFPTNSKRRKDKGFSATRRKKPEAEPIPRRKWRDPFPEGGKLATRESKKNIKKAETPKSIREN